MCGPGDPKPMQLRHGWRAGSSEADTATPFAWRGSFSGKQCWASLRSAQPILLPRAPTNARTRMYGPEDPKRCHETRREAGFFLRSEGSRQRETVTDCVLLSVAPSSSLTVRVTA
jgi:hypothetical protein